MAAVVAGALFFGGDMCTGSAPPRQAAQEQTAPAAQDDQKSFVGVVLDDVQETFGKQIRGYEPARLTLFRGSVRSACGTATSAVGPFYCPLDKRAYIDLAFYDQLKQQFGAPGDFAQAYVIAHEIGHHVQNLRGALGERDREGSIATELQADCLAGAWAKDAEKRQLLEVGDIDEALNAAAQIGDDTLQKKGQGHVQPETWTHGSAAQRKAAFQRGHAGGIPACGEPVAAN